MHARSRRTRGGSCDRGGCPPDPVDPRRAVSEALRDGPGRLVFFSSRRRHTRSLCDWSSDVCSSDVAQVLQGDILTTGAEVAEFEARFAAYLGQRHAFGVTSCTGALHMALLALDIGPGDEVITTPMSFVATATAILEAGATPVFVDVEADTGNLDAARVETAITPKTRAIMPVHLYGLMCDMRALRAIADKHGLRLIEDAAHCIEGVRDGVRPGELSDAACFSF